MEGDPERPAAHLVWDGGSLRPFDSIQSIDRLYPWQFWKCHEKSGYKLKTSTTTIRGLIGVSIARGEGKFVLLQLAFQSIFGRQVCKFVFVPEKTGWLRKASLYLIFPIIGPFLYQAVQGVSKHKTFSRTFLGTSKNELSLRRSPRNPRNTQNQNLHVPRTVLDKLWNFACS